MTDDRQPPPPPRISVIMPLFNCAGYLLQSLRSISRQTFTDFEIIAIDDGSTDATGLILDEFASTEPRCRVWHTANGGIVAALNLALAHARGSYIARMDGDDIARCDRFDAQVNYLDANPDCVCVGSLFRTIDANGTLIATQRVPLRRFRQTNLDVFPPHVASPPHPSIMVRRSDLDAIGGYRPFFPHAEDQDMFLRLARRGTIDLIHEHLLDYRVHASSLSAENSLKQIDGKKKAILSALACARGIQDPAERYGDTSFDKYFSTINDKKLEKLFLIWSKFLIIQRKSEKMTKLYSIFITVDVILYMLRSFFYLYKDRRYYEMMQCVFKQIVNVILR